MINAVSPSDGTHIGMYTPIHGLSGASGTQRMEPLGLPILGEVIPALVGCMQLPLLVTRPEVRRISV